MGTAAEGISSAAAEAAAAKAGSTAGTGVRTFVVTTQIDNRSGFLKPGMTGLAKVVGGHRRVFDLVTRRLSHMFKVEFWPWWEPAPHRTCLPAPPLRSPRRRIRVLP